MTIRVVVADDQALVRSGFTMLLAGEPDIDVVGEASNGVEAVALAASAHPDVMLMDIRMPVMDGLEATRRISEDPSLAIHPHPDPDDLRSRRVRARGSAGRCERVPAQGHDAGRPDPGGAGGRGRRRAHRASDHAPADRGVRPAPRTRRRGSGDRRARPAHRSRNARSSNSSPRVTRMQRSPLRSTSATQP